MAYKKDPKAIEKAKASDALTYRIFAAFAIAIISICVLMYIYRIYPIGANFLTVQTALFRVGIAFGVLALAGLIVALASGARAPKGRKTGFCLLAAGVLLCASCFFMYAYYLTAVKLLCFVYPALAVYYLIAHIYQRDFFVFSVICGAAAMGFYCLSKLLSGVGFPIAAVVILIAEFVFLLVCGAALLLCSKNDGKLRLFGRELKVFPSGAYLELLAITCAAFIVCFILCAVLGSMASYCLMFAAIAYLFAVAVFYTVKLM